MLLPQRVPAVRHCVFQRLNEVGSGEDFVVRRHASLALEAIDRVVRRGLGFGV